MARRGLMGLAALGVLLSAGVAWWKADRIFGPFFFRGPKSVACDESRVLFRYQGLMGDELGSKLGALGDLDGDGRAEIGLGAPERAGGGHLVVVSSSSAGSLLELGPSGAWCFASSAADAGDVDGDGRPDLAVGATSEGRPGPGNVRIYSSEGALLRTYEGRRPIDHYGHALADVGDVDGDGHTDLLITAPGSWKKEHSGYAEVRSGKTGDAIHDLGDEGEKGDRFGFAATGVGDWDRDGTPDFAITALNDGAVVHAGRVYVYSGKGAQVLHVIDGDVEWDELGHDLVDMGDVDGDGVHDLLVGSFAQKRLGYTRLYSGGTGTQLYEVTGVHVGDAFGHTLSRVDDVDDDGVSDFAVGLPDLTVDGVRRVGGVRVYSGRSGKMLFEVLGCREREHFGYGLEVAGDINRDGSGDLLVGTVVTEGLGRAVILSGRPVLR